MERFYSINCFHLLQGTYYFHLLQELNRKNKYRFRLFHYQWTLQREEQDGKEWICTSNLVLSCRVVITSIFTRLLLFLDPKQK